MGTLPGLIQIGQIGAQRRIFGLSSPRRVGAHEQMCKRKGSRFIPPVIQGSRCCVSFKVKDKSGLCWK